MIVGPSGEKRPGAVIIVLPDGRKCDINHPIYNLPPPPPAGPSKEGEAT